MKLALSVFAKRLPAKACALSGLALLGGLAPSSLYGDGGAGTQSYFVPLPEGEVRIALESLLEARGGTPVGSEMNTVVSIVAGLEGTVICYDHWEDGYESDLGNPVQASTEVWGDGDPGNGIPPGFGADLLAPGDVIALENAMNLPRNPSQIRYDGRDHFSSTRPVALTRASWASQPGPVLAGAVEVMPAKDLGLEFVAPVGEDTDFDEVYEYVSLFVMATEDGSALTIDTDGDGVVNVNTNLQRGESYFLDGGVMEGATVTSTKPIQVHLLTGDLYPSGSYETRWYTLFPRSDWSNIYYSPVGSADDATASLIVYNPHASTLAVSYTTGSGGGTLQIPAGATRDLELPVQSGARLEALDGRAFSAIAAVASGGNADNDTYDWGFSLVPNGNLTQEALVGWGPGVAGNANKNGNPVFVTAVEDTTIYIDYDGDPLSGANTDPLGRQYDDSILADALESHLIFDTADDDQTGMRLYTVDGVRITAAWGQDPDSSNPGNPFLDLGTTVLPFPSAAAEIISMLVNDVNGNGVADVGDTVEYVATVSNLSDTTIPVGNIALINSVPNEITFLPGTSTLNGVPVPDDVVGTPYPFDGAGQSVSDLGPGEGHEVRYQAIINVGGVPIVNTFTAITDIGTLTDTDTLNVPAPLTEASVTQQIAVISDGNGNGQADLGDTLEYTITAYNSGVTTLTGVSLLDSLPAELTYVALSSTVNGAGVADDGAGTAFPFDNTGYGVPALSPGNAHVFTFQATVNSNGVIIVNPADLVTDAGTFLSISELEVPTAPAANPVLTVTALLAVDNNGNGLPDFNDTVTYTVRLFNGGTSLLTGITVIDDLPSGLAYVEASSTVNAVPATDDFSGTPFPFDTPGVALPDLASGGSHVLTFDTVVSKTGTTIVNEATASTDSGEVRGSHTLKVPARAGSLAALSLLDGGGVPVQIYEEGDTVFVRVDDADQDVLSGVAETVAALLTNLSNGDQESLILTETGPSTGVFEGSIASSVTTGLAAEDGTLHAKSGEAIRGSYTDPKFGDEAAAEAEFGKGVLVKTLYWSEGESMDRIDPVVEGDTTTSSTLLEASTSPADYALTASEDSWLDQGNPATGYGLAATMSTDTSGGDLGDGRVVLKFDLSLIPAGGTISNAVLKLTKTGGSTASKDVEVHAVSSPWSEATVTWNSPWGSSGGDYNGTPLDGQVVSADQEYAWSGASLTALVQDWVDGTSTNHGLMVGSPNTGGDVYLWASREAAGGQPVLEFTYSPSGGLGQGMAVWSASSTQEYSVWDGASFSPKSTFSTSGRWRVLQGATSATRDEAVVLGVESGGSVSGMRWNGSTWDTTDLTGLASLSETLWWSVAVAYEGQSDRSMVVWADDNSAPYLSYKIWDGTSWSAATTVSAYTGEAVKHLRLASDPASDAMVLVVNAVNESDYALVWDGTAWGNEVLLDTSTAQDRTDIHVAYESLSGEAIVVYDNDSDGSVHFRLWDGSSWSAEGTVTAPGGTAGYGRWTTLASDPNSDRILLGVQTSSLDGWVNFWDGSAWETSFFVTGAVDAFTSPNLVVGFESNSGEALVAYGRAGQPNFYSRTWDGSSWSGESLAGSLGDETNSLALTADPSSDAIMVIAQDDGSDLNYYAWDGDAWDGGTVLETSSGETESQPFLFLWNRWVSASSVILTQTPPMATDFVMPAGGILSARAFVTLPSGVIGPSPHLTASLLENGELVAAMNSPSSVALGGSQYQIDWSGVLPAETLVETGHVLEVVVQNGEPQVVGLAYDSDSFPSKIDLPTRTVIQVQSIELYDAPYPGGNRVTQASPGQTVFVRTTVSDPFGAYDITGLDLVITTPGGASLPVVNLGAADVIETTASSKVYEYFWWTPTEEGTATVAATAHEGSEGITDVRVAGFPLIAKDFGTGGSLVFATAGGTVKTNFNVAEAIQMRLTDLDQNGDPALIDSISVDVTSTGGFVETRVLTETGLDTGVFSYLYPASTFAEGDIITGRYIDPLDPSDEATASAVINTSVAPGTPTATVEVQPVTPTDGSAGIGEAVVFNVTVANPGTVTLDTVVLDLDFPSANLAFVGSSLPADAPTADSLQWPGLGPLAPGSFVKIEVSFRGEAPTPAATVTANVSGTATAGPDAVTVSVNQPQVGVGITMTSPVSGTVLTGDLATVELSVTNSGTTDLSVVPVSLQYGSCYQFVSASVAENGSGGGVAVWDNLGPLLGGQTLTIDVTLEAVLPCVPAVSTLDVSNAVDANGDFVPPSRATLSSTIIQTISSPNFTVNEATGVAMVAVSVPLATPAPVSVDYQTSDGTAVAGVDYTAVSGTLTIPAGQTTVEVPVPLLNDALFERNETFQFNLSNPVGTALGTGSVVTILDDECEGTLYLIDTPSSDLYTLDLSAAATNVLRNAIAAFPIDGIGYNRRDHFLWGFKQVAPWDTVVRINPDQSVDEFVIAGLLAEDYHSGDVDSSGILHLGKGGEALIKRIDVNPASPNYLQWLPDRVLSEATTWGDWSFNAQDDLLYSVNESAELYRIDPASGLVSKLGNLTGVTGSGAFGASYVDSTGALYVIRQDTGIVYRLPDVHLLTGATAPITEFYSRTTPGLVSDGARCAIAPPPSPAPLRLSVSDALAFEGDGSATVTVTLSQTSASAVDFSYVTLENTATEGVDYTAVSGNQSISPGSLSVNLSIPILQDTQPEGQESFFVNLSGVGANTILARDVGIVSITDDDSVDTDRDGSPDIDDIDDDNDGILDVDESFAALGCAADTQVLLLMDNSGSISSGEWDDLEVFAEDVIDAIGAGGTARMAVAHYWTKDGTPNLYLESDFQTDPEEVKKFTRRGARGDHLDEAISLLGHALDGTGTGVTGNVSTLTHVPGSRFHVILLTDAYRDLWGFTALIDPAMPADPFHFVNDFKSSGYAPTMTVVRFNGGDPSLDATANAAAAAIASVGGIYAGNIEANAGDPQGSLWTPRRFYNVSRFGSIPATLAGDLVNVICEGNQDFDGDLYADHLDLDSDNDGIPDNIEAQATENYVPPNGDAGPANFGLDSAYAPGLRPVDSDQDGVTDVYDDDSDADGTLDIEENGDSDDAIVGMDQDGDGLDDRFDTENVLWDVNDRIDDPNPVTLGDVDNDLAPDGNNATAMIRDVDFRDPGKQTNYTDWQDLFALALGAQSGLTENPDEDLYDNLLEYALCLHPGSGLAGPGGFFLESNGGGIEARFYRPVGGLSDVTYEIRARSSLPIAGTETWELVLTIDGNGAPPAGATVSAYTDVIEEVRVPNLETYAPLTPELGFIRLTVVHADHSSYAPVWGWTETVIAQDHQETFSNPYTAPEQFSGVIDAVTGTHGLDVSTSTGGIRLETLLRTTIEDYYLEVYDGDENGHRFDIESVSGSTITLAADSDLYAGPPYNTQVTPVSIPSSLAGDKFILRRHLTLDDVFPPDTGAFTPQDHTVVPGRPPDRLYFFEGDWEPYWLYSNTAGSGPFWDLDGNALFVDAGKRVVPPGHGVFVQPEETTVTMLALGVVRKNPFAMPLPHGWSLQGSVYPMDQSPAERDMDQESFSGSDDPSTSDTVCYWLGDLPDYNAAFRCAFLFDPNTVETPRWLYADDEFLNPRDFDRRFFPKDRSAFYFRYAAPKPEYMIPLPWCTDVIDE